MLFINYTTIDLIFELVIAVVAVVMCVFLSLKVINALQFSNYRAYEYFAYCKRTKYTQIKRRIFLAFLSALGMGLYSFAFFRFGAFIYLGFLFFVVLGILYLLWNKSHNSKSPLKYTKRLKRLILSLSLLVSIIVTAIVLLIPSFANYVVLGIMPIVIVPVVLLANFLMMPIEKHINNGFIKRAKQKIASMPNLIVIGITGSYGKTTAKNILYELLSIKYKVCSTQGNYNTPMGVCLTINNKLQDNDQVLILEMGARYQGDILELVDIVKLDYCMITSVGECHIETFGSKSAILETKASIVKGLKERGIAVVDGTNMMLLDILRGENSIVPIGGNTDFANVRDIVVSSQGTKFVLDIDSNSIDICTSILGRHIPSTIAMCVALVYKMGITDLMLLIKTVSQLKPIEHRLQLLTSSDSDTIVIDDSYNANVQGMQNALEVLESFCDYQKVIITPGVVEQGAQKLETNMTIGQYIYLVCDYAILVGSNGEYIKKGIEKERCVDNNEKSSELVSKINCNIQLVENREQAVQYLKTIQGKKAVLFCNDLPDSII